MFDEVLGRFVDETDPLDTPMRVAIIVTMSVDLAMVSIAFSIANNELSGTALTLAQAALLFGLVFWVVGPVAVWYDAAVVKEHTDWSPRRIVYTVASLIPGYFRVTVLGWYMYKRWRAVRRMRAQSDAE